MRDVCVITFGARNGCDVRNLVNLNGARGPSSAPAAGVF